jgi:hypothetical protein
VAAAKAEADGEVAETTLDRAVTADTSVLATATVSLNGT